MHEILERHYGKEYLCRSLVDLHLNKGNAKVFQLIGQNGDDPTVFKTIWDFLFSNAKSIFESAVKLIQNLKWEYLAKLKSVPNYLGSLFRVCKELLEKKEESDIIKLLNAFVAGAKKFWEFLKELVPILDISLIIDSVSSLFTQYGSTFIGGLQVVFNGFKTVITSVVGLYAQVAQNLGKFSADFVTTIFDTVGVRRKAVKTIIFALIATQDIFQIAEFAAGKMRDYLMKFGQELAKSNINLLKEIDPLMSKFLMKTSIIANLRGYLNSLEEILNWLHNIVFSIVQVCQHFVFAFMQKVSRAVSKIIVRIMKNVPVVQNYLDMSKACTELSQRSDVTIENKEKLKEVVRFKEKFEEQVENETKKRFQSVLDDKDPKQIFKSASVGAEICTKLYYEDNVTKEEFDTVIFLRTGVESSFFQDSSRVISKLMVSRFFVADEEKEKEKVDADITDFEPFSTTTLKKKLKEAEEQLKSSTQKFEKTQSLLERIEMSESDRYYYERIINNYKNSITGDESIDLFNAQKEKLQFQLNLLNKNLIDKYKEQLKHKDDLKKEISLIKEAILRNDLNERSLSKKIICVLTLVGLGAGIYWSYGQAKLYQQDAARVTFDRLLTKSNNDFFLEFQVQKFAAEEGIKLSERELSYQRFQQWQSEKLMSIQDGKMPDKEQNVWISKLSWALTEQQKVSDSSNYFYKLLFEPKYKSEKKSSFYSDLIYDKEYEIELEKDGYPESMQHLLKKYINLKMNAEERTKDGELLQNRNFLKQSLAYIFEMHQKQFSNAFREARLELKEEENTFGAMFKQTAKYVYGVVESTGMTGTDLEVDAFWLGIQRGAFGLVDQKMALYRFVAISATNFVASVFETLFLLTKVLVYFIQLDPERITEEFVKFNRVILNFILTIAAEAGLAATSILSNRAGPIISIIRLVLNFWWNWGPGWIGWTAKFFTAPLRFAGYVGANITGALLNEFKKEDEPMRSTVLKNLKKSKFSLPTDPEALKILLSNLKPTQRQKFLQNIPRTEDNKNIIAFYESKKIKCDICRSEEAQYHCKNCGFFCSIGCSILNQ